jgi:hypothetical protein
LYSLISVSFYNPFLRTRRLLSNLQADSTAISDHLLVIENIEESKNNLVPPSSNLRHLVCLHLCLLSF